MAERRMLCKSVVESDSFLDMPADAQTLYLHLNMAADDDGFVANPRSIMRLCGAKDDSMRLLIQRKFVLTFEKKDNFVVVIKHWRLNNYIQKDRYRETKYKEFMRELYYDENKSYSLNPNDGHYPCIPDENPAAESDVDTPRIQPVSTLDSQDRVRLEVGEGLDKESTGKSKEEENKTSIFLSEKNSQNSASGNPNPESQIKYWHDRVELFKRQGFEADGIYALASANGVSREEIDSYEAS